MQISRRAQNPHVRAYEKYAKALIECLPMDDTVLIAKLSKYGLLAGDTSDHLKALPTQGSKASYFLDHVIKPALDIDDTSGFDDLLSVMEHCGYDHVEKLAYKIKSEIDKANDVTMFVPGKDFSYQYIVTYNNIN